MAELLITGHQEQGAITPELPTNVGIENPTLSCQRG